MPLVTQRVNTIPNIYDPLLYALLAFLGFLRIPRDGFGIHFRLHCLQI
jgi:hypothetical protein